MAARRPAVVGRPTSDDAIVGGCEAVLTALWSANQGSKAMLSALNDVYGENEKRGFVRRTATSCIYGGGVVSLLVATGAIVILPLAFSAIGLQGASDVIAKIARWRALVLGFMFGLALLYRYGPSRHLAKWRWVTWAGPLPVSWIGPFRRLFVDLAFEHGASSWRADQCGDGNANRSGHDNWKRETCGLTRRESRR